MCVEEAKVLYVSPTGPDSGTCPKASPCSIAQASAVADQTRNNIKLAPGNYSARLILTNKTLVFYGVGATIAGQGTEAVFEVNDNARLRINGVSMSAAGGVIRCGGTAAGGTVELFRATLTGVSGTLVTQPCTLTVEQSELRSTSATGYALVLVGPTVAKFNRTRFIGNGMGIAGLADATIQISNSVFKTMGSSAKHGVFNGAAYDVSFSTIIDSVVECGASGATSMTLSSSILYYSAAGAPTDTLVNGNACTSVKNSVIFPNAQPVAPTNVSQQPALKNVSAEDFHLMATSPAIDRGDPASTNAVDFDGTPRPQGAGRDSGAFEFKP